MLGLRYALVTAAAATLFVAIPVGVGLASPAVVAHGGHGHCTQPRTGSEVCVSPGDAELRSWPDPADLPTPPDVPERPENL